MSERRLGVHTSIAGGLHFSIERAKALGCSTVQIFSHNPRQWAVRRHQESEIAAFRDERKTYDIRPLYVHTSYLINLASLDREVLMKSKRLLLREMDLADLIGADFVVLHTGSASQDSAPAARGRAISALQEVLGTRQWRSRLLLENTAGEKGDISSRMEDLAGIMHKTGSPVIGGVCIDTCHAFSAGYDIATEEGVSILLGQIDEHLGLERVKLIHLNDSKRGHGSGVDRHEHIGLGAIGAEGLGRLLNHPAIRHIPLILETPKKSEEDDRRNLSVVRGLFRQ